MASKNKKAKSKKPAEASKSSVISQIHERINALEEQASEQLGELVDRGRGLPGYRRFKELAESSRANQALQEIEEKLRHNELVERVDAWTAEVEKQVETSVERLFKAAGLATRADLKAIDRRLRKLSRRITEIDKRAA